MGIYTPMVVHTFTHGCIYHISVQKVTYYAGDSDFSHFCHREVLGVKMSLGEC